MATGGEGAAQAALSAQGLEATSGGFREVAAA